MKKYLKTITRNRLFIGSGTDDVFDENLHTTLDEYGQYVVDYHQAKREGIEKIVYNADDSRNEDHIAKDIFSKIPNIRYNKQFGYYTDLYAGYVTEGAYRKNGSSGGFITWVATQMLEAGMIDGFVHVKKSRQPGLLFEYGISRTSAAIKSGAKSRYYPAELSKVLKEIKETPGKYAVVGIPEIITELRLLAENDPIINDRVKYYFGLVTGHQKTTKYAEAIAWEYGIKPGDLEEIDFRVKRNVGTAAEYDMKVVGKVDGVRKTFLVGTVAPFVSDWGHGFFKARLSDFTDDTFNEVADIAFGDAWLDEYIRDSAGTNILIVRKPEIAKLIKQGIKNKEVYLDKIDEETITRSQQGLIHHTRDELPYRLYKEEEKYGWAPKKRVKPSNDLDPHRKEVQDVRQAIAEKSHIYYRKAVKKGSYDYFKKKMLPYTQKYKELYKGPDKYPAKKVRADGAIVTLTSYSGYGNILQRYALQKFLKNNGLNYVSYMNSQWFFKSLYPVDQGLRLRTPLRFVRRLLRNQKPYWYMPRIYERGIEAEDYPYVYNNQHLIDFVNRYIKVKQFDPNDNYKNYIVGSDQVWRNWSERRELFGYYFLDFLKGSKANRVSYAASFGKDKALEVMSKEDIQYIKPYIEQFNAISVREKSGEKLISDTWGIGGVETVVDPTLLLDRSEYSRLINKKKAIKHDEIKPIFAYILDETPATTHFIKRIQEARNQEVTNIRADIGSENDVLPPVELWLKGFRDAELVITNSFHGMMFSIINNTDFIVMGREAGGLSRIKDFLKEYGLEHRFVDEDKLDKDTPTDPKPINWKAVNKKLEQRRRQSATWLLRAVNNK